MNRSDRKRRSSCAEGEVCSSFVEKKENTLDTAGVVRDSAFIRLYQSIEECEIRAYITCMLARGILLLVSLFVVGAASVFGQLPTRAEKCLPYPTLGQEIRETGPTDPVPKRVRVRVIRVEFDTNDNIPADVREEISAELRSHVFQRDIGHYLPGRCG